MNRYLLLCFSALLIQGCFSFQNTTVRPPFAYPQHLDSMCLQTTEISVANEGEFRAFNAVEGRDNRMLLAAQFLSAKPSEQRQFSVLRFNYVPAGDLVVTARGEAGLEQVQTFPASDLRCNEDGELILQLHKESYYLYASMGSKQRELALWTNKAGDLVLQNRWRDTVRGLVGGEETGDAWARFAATGSPDVQAPVSIAAEQPQGCLPLQGRFGLDASVIRVDGSLDSLSAMDQFFAPEDKAVPAYDRNLAEYFEVLHQPDGNLDMHLVGEGSILHSRSIPAKQLNCIDGRWQLRGEREMLSGWLLLMASGGMLWEDLVLWLDSNGNLSVEGERVSRGAIFLIPIGTTQKLFMSFPLYR